jgi:thiol-disulfide isomerase/thioredoxin
LKKDIAEKEIQAMLKLMSTLILLLFCCTLGYAAALEPPREGEPLPDILLPAIENAGLQRYLGVSGSGAFSVNDIPGEVLIIQIFSMYCPHCQADAPFVNELHNKIQESPQIRGKIKLLGIGVGNSIFEVDFFRNKYNVAFPLFADEKFVIHQQVAEVRTPILSRL